MFPLFFFLSNTLISSVQCESAILNNDTKIVISEYVIQDSINSNETKLNESFVDAKIDLNPNEYCRKIKTCAECVKTTLYKCEWCHDYGCTDDALKLCPRAVKRFQNLKSTDLCPSIKYNDKIIIPYGIKVNIKVKLNAPDPAVHKKEAICQVKLENHLTHLRALIIQNMIYCYPIMFKYKPHKGAVHGTLQIIWGGMEPFSNVIPITIYRCENLANDCNSCISIPKAYACGWCPNTNVCVIGEECSEDIIRWSLNRLNCNDKKLRYT